ncbi:MAG TPA: NAD-dependent epimerase/dehydratase family protein [Bryobacteraceae bacterium]|nr:NAD-dependent epimerase/dehydratase family protein [Bryobacteraceae bacterium]
MAAIQRAMRIVIIGGTGFIGSYVAARLAEEHDVTVLHRGRHSGALPDSVHHLVGDRDRLIGLDPEFRRRPPDVVLDMIAGDERQARAVVDAFRGIAGRLVTTSSIDVYRTYEISLGLAQGPLEPVPLTEDSPLRTTRHPFRNRPAGSVPFDWVTPDYDKIVVEQVVRSEPALAATILRLPMVYGPGDPLHRFHGFLKRMDDARPALLIEETWARWQGPMGYVEDVAAAIALAVTREAAAGRTYNVAEADALTWADWASAVGEAAGWQGRIVTLPRDQTPKHLVPPFNAAQHWTADSSRIRQELGFHETLSRAEGLARTVAWERKNPPPVNSAAFDYEAEDRALLAAGGR